jgi:hypothetical protein
MHHYRGTLLEGDKICLDPANVYIDSGSTGVDPASGWSGYLLVAPEKAKEVVMGSAYTLKLVDGRAGELRISKVEPDDSDKVRALFVGEGSLK